MKRNCWLVIKTWEIDGEQYESVVESGLSKLTAFEIMIAKAKIHEGTGVTFSCRKEVA